MRLWSLHPMYLDSKGLVALWREGLLARAVLAGQTRGYRNHPQLVRFLQATDPGAAVAAYLRVVHVEAVRRGYRFDPAKLGPVGDCPPLEVTRGQLAYEWIHLIAKLEIRAPGWLDGLGPVALPELHPLFRLIEGGIAAWEVGAAVAQAVKASLDESWLRDNDEAIRNCNERVTAHGVFSDGFRSF